MTKRPSLLAERLRHFRATAGEHGRLTQEELAERLGVSVDAIGKYERSVSFPRGDLEHLLSERLGWTREAISECRLDWETHHLHPKPETYRLLDDVLLEDVYGGSLEAASRDVLSLSAEAMGNLPEAFQPFEGPWHRFNLRYPSQWRAVLKDGRMVAKWVLALLNEDDEARFRNGTLIEAEISADRMRRPILPGRYFGYCPALVVRPGHEAASRLLLGSFVAFLEDLLMRDIFLQGVGAIAVNEAGSQLCADLGMTNVGTLADQQSFRTWELAGADMAGSVFGKQSPIVRDRYGSEFAAD